MNKLYIIPKGDIVSYAAAINYEKNIPFMVQSVNSIMKELNLDKSYR